MKTYRVTYKQDTNFPMFIAKDKKEVEDKFSVLHHLVDFNKKDLKVRDI